MVPAQGQQAQENRDEEDEDEIGFEEMGLDPRLLRAAIKKGLTKPTPIQLKAIPLILVRILSLPNRQFGSHNFSCKLLILHFCASLSSGSSQFCIASASHCTEIIWFLRIL
jgi:hypothetical protein